MIEVNITEEIWKFEMLYKFSGRLNVECPYPQVDIWHLFVQYIFIQ